MHDEGEVAPVTARPGLGGRLGEIRSKPAGRQSLRSQIVAVQLGTDDHGWSVAGPRQRSDEGSLRAGGGGAAV